MITEEEYQKWLKRNRGMDLTDCQLLLDNARYQHINNPTCKAASGVYWSALYCISRYESEELC